jgi:outer membrane cobalamin receptor
MNYILEFINKNLINKPMKNNILLLLAGFMLFTTGFTTTAEDSQRQAVYASEVDDDLSRMTLDEYLSGISGIRVTGVGRTANIRIEGYVKSPNTTPLFIIDGSRIGRDFQYVFDLIDMSLVDRVQVLRSPRARAIYGGEGQAGAIVIHYKDRDKELD